MENASKEDFNMKVGLIFVKSEVTEKGVCLSSLSSSENISCKWNDKWIVVASNSYSVKQKLELEEEIDFERALSDDVVLNVNDFVLVEFAGKREVVMYVGQIEEVKDEGESYKVKFMRKKNDSWKFYFPAQEYSSSVERKDIKMKLPQPNLSGGTAPAVSAMTFSINLSLVHQKIK